MVSAVAFLLLTVFIIFLYFKASLQNSLASKNSAKQPMSGFKLFWNLLGLFMLPLISLWVSSWGNGNQKLKIVSFAALGVAVAAATYMIARNLDRK
jgi:ABC-type multidrug transport system permease subunit